MKKFENLEIEIIYIIDVDIITSSGFDIGPWDPVKSNNSTIFR